MNQSILKNNTLTRAIYAHVQKRNFKIKSMITVENYGNIENVTICQFGNGTMRICSASAKDGSYEALLMGDTEEPHEIGEILPRAKDSDEFAPKVAITFDNKKSFDVFDIYVNNIRKRFQEKEPEQTLNLTQDEELIKEAILDARKVQEFIWGELSLLHDDEFNKDVWTSVFLKRVNKIAEISPDNPAAKIELRKRVLQQAALSILALIKLKD